jgi:hypothetical protein
MSVGPPSDRQRDLTVAHVRERPGLDVVEVMFLESARTFRLTRSHEHFHRVLSALRAAEAEGRSVRVTLTIPNGGDIDEVERL